MLSHCNFCHEAIPEQTAECPFCGEVNGVPGCTRHYFRQYYLAACPLCQARPLLKTDRVCPNCNANLHEFSVDWGFSQPNAKRANKFARKLATAEKPPGLVWHHSEGKGRICVSVDIGAERDWAFSFQSLCINAGFGLRGTEYRHAGRLCKASLPGRWLMCFFGYRQLVDVPEKLRAVAFEYSDWNGEY